jgi:predicted regulator of Ras-like GTPase activity (Roadblock/LC7/MglB family)
MRSHADTNVSPVDCLDVRLADILEELVATSDLDGMMIGSEQGLLVAESNRVANGALLAAMGALFEATVLRAEEEGLIASVGEMTMRGDHGEHVIVRYFPRLAKRFFLLAYSSAPKPHRKVTNAALRRCGLLLAGLYAEPGRSE